MFVVTCEKHRLCGYNFIFRYILGCTVDEMQTIVAFEDERHNLGHFQLVYPHPNTVNSHKMAIKDFELDSVLTEYVDQIRKF